MFKLSRKTKENICLTVSIACLLVSVLWIYYYATLTGDTNLTGFHVIMWGFCLPFGGLFLGLYIAPAVTALIGFFNTANYWHTDRPTIRIMSRVTVIAQGILTAAMAVLITLVLTR